MVDEKEAAVIIWDYLESKSEDKLELVLIDGRRIVLLVTVPKNEDKWLFAWLWFF